MSKHDRSGTSSFFKNKDNDSDRKDIEQIDIEASNVLENKGNSSKMNNSEDSIKQENEQLLHCLTGSELKRQTEISDKAYMFTDNQRQGNSHKKHKTKFEVYDVQQMYYEIGKEYDGMKPEKTHGFLERMIFDSYKRQKKDEQISNFVNKKKPKVAKKKQMEAFKRLYKDSERRINARTSMPEKMEEDSSKVKHFDFESFYAREKKFTEEVELKKRKILEEKIKEEEQKELEEVKMVPNKKVNEKQVKLMSERLYRERQLLEMKIEAKKQEFKNEADKAEKKLKDDDFYKILNRQVKEKEVEEIVDRLSVKTARKVMTEYKGKPKEQKKKKEIMYKATIEKSPEKKTKPWVGESARKLVENIFKKL